MAKDCKICNLPTIFFVWSTDRRFDLHKYIMVRKQLENREKVLFNKDGEVVGEIAG